MPQQQRMFIAAVKQAKLYAVAAVAADNGQDYVNAAGNYRAAVKSLKGEIANVPKEDLDIFMERVCLTCRRNDLTSPNRYHLHTMCDALHDDRSRSTRDGQR